jgi:hypothetical protein
VRGVGRPRVKFDNDDDEDWRLVRAVNVVRDMVSTIPSTNEDDDVVECLVRTVENRLQEEMESDSVADDDETIQTPTSPKTAAAIVRPPPY